MQVCWQQVCLVFFYLIMSHFIFILEWSFQWIQHSELPICCFALLFTSKMLFPSLRDSTVFDKKWYIDWIVVLLHVLRHCSLGLYHRFSTLFTTVCLTWRGILCLLCLVFASPICLFSIFFFFIVSISRLRRLISVLRFLCIENMFHAMKTWRKVKAMALRFLSVSFNIWFILGLKSIDFLLCRERVPFSWCLGCWEILDCILNNIKLWRFLSGLELQTLYFV